jgi:hypothetical protein
VQNVFNKIKYAGISSSPVASNAKTRTVLERSNTGNMGSNSTSIMSTYSLFSVIIEAQDSENF